MACQECCRHLWHLRRMKTSICSRFVTTSLITDMKLRGVTDNTFQIGLVDPGFVWGGNSHNKMKPRNIHYSYSNEENNECNNCYHLPPDCHYEPFPCDWKPCPPGCSKQKTTKSTSRKTPVIPKHRYPHHKFPPTKAPKAPVCDECWWKPPCLPPCDYTSCPEECPPPEPICAECQWVSPCKESDDKPCEWKPCPEICRPATLKIVRSICEECSWEAPCKSGDEPCEWKPCPDSCRPHHPPKVTQIWDGQVQAPCRPPGHCPLPPHPKVTQIWDGQIQGPIYRHPPHHLPPPLSPPRVTQIWDGQIQAPDPHPWYKRMFKRDQSKNYQRSEMAMP